MPAISTFERAPAYYFAACRYNSCTKNERCEKRAKAQQLDGARFFYSSRLLHVFDGLQGYAGIRLVLRLV